MSWDELGLIPVTVDDVIQTRPRTLFDLFLFIGSDVPLF